MGTEAGPACSSRRGSWNRYTSRLLGRQFIAPYPEAFTIARLLGVKVGHKVVERAIMLGDVSGSKSALANAIGLQESERLLALARSLDKGGGFATSVGKAFTWAGTRERSAPNRMINLLGGS